MPDEETKRIMEDHGLDKEDAEKVQRIMEEEGLDEDDAVELKDDL
jgi:hypothetical protein